MGTIAVSPSFFLDADGYKGSEYGVDTIDRAERRGNGRPLGGLSFRSAAPRIVKVRARNLRDSIEEVPRTAVNPRIRWQPPGAVRRSAYCRIHCQTC
jgi:hypothetical protein